MKTLRQLLPNWNGADAEIHSLTLDSRAVVPGCLFLAVPGQRHDGRDYIARALEAGAAAIVYEAQGAQVSSAAVPLVPVEGLVAQLSAIAGRFYDQPSAQLGVIGVTGTNGKTSVSQMLAQVLTSLGQPCGIIGTLGSGMPGELNDHGMTTPDALRVQQQLAGLRDQGARWVSMEVSSHALDQGRVEALDFDVAVFTNLSRDHLDYHGDMDSYGAAKARLFQRPLGHAVINLDDPFGRQLLPLCSCPVITYSLHDPVASLYCTDIRYNSQGIQACLHAEGQRLSLTSPLLGDFNLSNLLAVIAALMAAGIELPQALTAVAAVQAPAGRMQRLGGEALPLVVIDYAHTPDALEKALAALRAHTRGRLTCVFGCGGDRDNGKRPLMARAAELGADALVITDDNPRTEPSAVIIEQILSGIEHTGNVAVIANRAEAISQIIQQARAGDVILLAGKGHETYQEIDGVRHPFSDIEQAEAALQAWEARHA